MTAAALRLRQSHPSQVAFALLKFALLLVAAFGILYPIFAFLGASLKTDGEFLVNPDGIPREWAFANYVDAWQHANMGTLILNSFIVSVCTVALTIALASTMAFGLVSFFFRGRAIILLSITMMLTIPVQVYIIPLYVISIKLHLVNSLAGLILPYAASSTPLALILFRNYFLDLPHELTEAARLDGCGRFGIY